MEQVNKCRGNANALRNILSQPMAIFGSNIGSDLLMWDALMNRLFQYEYSEKKLDQDTTFKMLQKALDHYFVHTSNISVIPMIWERL